MANVFEESLFSKYPEEYDEVTKQAISFTAIYCGDTIIRDTIFEIVTNYAKKRGLSVEILRYPFRDDELWAFTFVKSGTIFLCVNSELAICKQIFAVAHELYHIYCYAENTDLDTIESGSVLVSKTVDDKAVTREDSKANAFAGLILMPGKMLNQQLVIFGIKGNSVTVDDVLTLMELFALPYKAVVLRLAENNNITKSRVKELLSYDNKYIMGRIELTGKAQRWQQNRKDDQYYGSLLDDMNYNRENELLTKSRDDSDIEYLNKIKDEFSKPSIEVIN